MTTLLAASAFCSSHPNASSCNPNSVSGTLIAIVVAAFIVLVVLLDISWRFWSGSRGPVSRLLFALATLLTRALPGRR